MEDLFKYVRDTILHGMPAGCLVTKTDVKFDIGMWQHKSYEHSSEIYPYLRSKWTPHTVNLLILDDDCSTDNILKLMEDNAFETKLRSIYLIYCIAVKSNIVTPELCSSLKNQKYIMNSFSEKLNYKDYTIFVCDLLKNLLYY